MNTPNYVFNECILQPYTLFYFSYVFPLGNWLMVDHTTKIGLLIHQFDSPYVTYNHAFKIEFYFILDGKRRVIIIFFPI